MQMWGQTTYSSDFNYRNRRKNSAWLFLLMCSDRCAVQEWMTIHTVDPGAEWNTFCVDCRDPFRERESSWILGEKTQLSTTWFWLLACWLSSLANYGWEAWSLCCWGRLSSPWAWFQGIRWYVPNYHVTEIRKARYPAFNYKPQSNENY